MIYMAWVYMWPAPAPPGSRTGRDAVIWTESFVSSRSRLHFFIAAAACLDRPMQGGKEVCASAQQLHAAGSPHSSLALHSSRRRLTQRTAASRRLQHATHL